MVETKFYLEMKTRKFQLINDIEIKEDSYLTFETSKKPNFKLVFEKTRLKDLWLVGSFNTEKYILDTVRVQFDGYDFKLQCKIDIIYHRARDQDETSRTTIGIETHIGDSLPRLMLDLWLEEKDFESVKQELLGNVRYGIFGKELGRLENLKFQTVTEIMDLLADYAKRNNKMINIGSYWKTEPDIYAAISKKFTDFLYTCIEEAEAEHFRHDYD